MKLAIPSREFSGYIFDCDGTLADPICTTLHMNTVAGNSEGHSR